MDRTTSVLKRSRNDRSMVNGSPVCRISSIDASCGSARYDAQIASCAARKSNPTTFANRSSRSLSSTIATDGSSHAIDAISFGRVNAAQRNPGSGSNASIDGISSRFTSGFAAGRFFDDPPHPGKTFDSARAAIERKSRRFITPASTNDDMGKLAVLRPDANKILLAAIELRLFVANNIAVQMHSAALDQTCSFARRLHEARK